MSPSAHVPGRLPGGAAAARPWSRSAATLLVALCLADVALGARRVGRAGSSVIAFEGRGRSAQVAPCGADGAPRRALHDDEERPKSAPALWGRPAHGRTDSAESAAWPPRKRQRAVAVDETSDGLGAGDVGGRSEERRGLLAGDARAVPAEALASEELARAPDGAQRRADADAPGNAFTRRADDEAALQVVKYIGGFLRGCDSDVRPLIEDLLEKLRQASDEDIQLAVISALGAAALGRHEASAERAIAALGEAADTDLSERRGVWSIARALCKAVGGESPLNVEAAINILMRLVAEQRDSALEAYVASEFGAVLQGIPKERVEIAFEKLFEFVHSGHPRVRDIALGLLCSSVQQAEGPHKELFVRMILDTGGESGPSGKNDFLFDLATWLVDTTSRSVGTQVLEAFVEAFPELHTKTFQHKLLGLVIRVFEESVADDDLEKSALDGLAKMAAGSQDEVVQGQVIESLQLWLWLGAVGPESTARSINVLVDIGVSAVSQATKLAALDALSVVVWERLGLSGRFVSRHARLAVQGMAEVVATSRDVALQQSLTMHCAEAWTKRPNGLLHEGILKALHIDTAIEDPRALVAIVEHVGDIILHRPSPDLIPKAMDWLVRDVLLVSKDVEVRQAALKAGMALGTAGRLESAVEFLCEALTEDMDDDEVTGLREFAIHLLANASGAEARKAMATLVEVIPDLEVQSAQVEAIRWLAGALVEATEEPTVSAVIGGLVSLGVRFGAAQPGLCAWVVGALRPALGARNPQRAKRAISGLTRIFLRSHDAAVERSVAEAFERAAVVLGGPRDDLSPARRAVRCVARMAMATQHRDVRMTLGKQLAAAVLNDDAVTARLAIDGLASASVLADSTFRELSSSALSSARWHTSFRAPPMLEALDAATSELLRLAEGELDEVNGSPEARQFAPAA